MMIRWKASVFVVTSLFLLCCELYGWANSDKGRTEQLARKERGETETDNLVDEFVREEDFPTLKEWLDDREVLYKERASLVKEVCQKYGVSNSTSNSSVIDLISAATRADKNHLVERVKLSQFFVSRPHQVLGCLINKVASSSIVKTFLQLEGYAVKDVKSPHAYGNKLHPHDWDELKLIDANYLKFLIVRDPLERLVSCYKDKMITNTHWSLASFRKQVKQRAETVRNRRKKKIANLVDLSNNQNKRSSDMANSFWSSGSVLNSPLNLTNGTKNSKTVKSPKTVTIQPKPEDIPSFSDFLEFILSTDLLGTGFSSHWVPYWRQCTPCHFDYSGTRSSTRQIQINLL